MPPIFRPSILTLSILLAAPPMLAQTAPEPAHIANETELEQINVSAQRRYSHGYQPLSADVIGGGNTPLLTIPRSVNVVTAAVLEDRRPQSLDDALQTVSGIRQANTLAGTLDAVIKRGFGDNRDNSIMRNGMQMTQTHIFNPTAERVEVLKGPTSTHYGVQDPGGVINVVTKQPQFTAAHSINFSIGNHDAKQVGMDFTGPIGNTGLAYRFIADHRRSDYWRNFGKIDQTTLAPSIKYVGDGTTLTAAYEYLDYTVPFDRGTFLDSTSGSPNFGKPLAIPAERRLDEPFSEQSGKTHMFQFNADHYLNDNWKLRASYGLTYHTYDDWKARVINTSNNGRNIIDTATGTVPRRIDGTQGARLRVHNLNFALTGKIDTGYLKHDLSFGIDLMHNDRRLTHIYQGDRSNINMNNPVYGGIRPIPGVNTRISTTNNRQTEILKTFGLYANDSVSIGDKWVVSGGLRLNYFDQYAGRIEGTTFKVNTDNHGWNISPHLGVVYRITPQWSAYANWATSFRPQVSIGNSVPGNAPAERGVGYEIGSKFAGERLSAAIAAFHLTKENVRYTVQVGGTNETRFAGRARSYGVEAEIGGQLTDRLGINANYAYTRTKVLEGEPAILGLPLNNTPRHQLGLYLTYDFGQVAGGQLRGGIGGKYSGSWTVGNDNGGTWRLPAATVAEAFLSYDTTVGGHPLNLRLNGKNLTNRLYYTSSVGNSRYFPMIAIGNPREISLSAKFGF